MWQTKSSERAWHQYIQQKISESMNSTQGKNMTDRKTILTHQKRSLHPSPSSSINLSHQQSSMKNSKVHFSRSISHSPMNPNNTSPGNIRLLKATQQGDSKNAIKPIKNGVNIEFKLSTQIDRKRQKIINEQNSK